MFHTDTMTGMDTTNMRAWRALGRTFLDINLLVSNCGRSDVRTNHTVVFTLMAQSSLDAGANSTMQAAVGAGMDMLKSIGALVAMSGVVRMMEQLLRAPQWGAHCTRVLFWRDTGVWPCSPEELFVVGKDSDSFVSQWLERLPNIIQPVARDTFRWNFLWGPFAHRGVC